MNAKQENDGKTPPSSTSFKQVWASGKFTLSIYRKFMGWKFYAFIITRVLRELESFVYALIFAKALDELITIVSTDSSEVTDLIPYIAVLLAYRIFTSIINSIHNYTRTSARVERRGGLEKLLIDKYQELGLIRLEDPFVADRIKRAQDWIYMSTDLYYEIISMFAYIITLAVTGVSIFQFSPLIAILIMLVAVIQFIPTRYFTKKDFAWWFDNTQERRKSWDDYRNMTKPESLKEIFVTGGSTYFTKRFMRFHKKFNRGDLNIRKQDLIVATLIEQVDNIVVIYGYFLAFKDALLGLITVGDITLYLRTINIFNNTLGRIFQSMSYILDLSNRVSESVEIFNLDPMEDGSYKFPRFDEPPGIEIKNVSFKYPRAKKLVLKDFNLTIKPGEKIAIVGHNGAGKTTLVKLLARLYDVEKGEILINGHEIRDLKIDDWYKNMGILFQEFNFYPQLSAEENIFVGKPVKKADREKAVKAAKAADAHEFIMEYEHKYKESMSERYDDGTRPSSGQKQKIALARFFYRDAPFAIFDEPTAAIDAVSEYKIFNEIYNFFEGKTVVIISHRFSTVRNADRILVMDKGVIVEEGSHEELMKLDGEYAKAFKLQAEGYQF